MEYTIKKLAELSGVSTRTLRYYDEINLLKPARINSSGYRIYGQTEVDRLQQILFYRSLDMKLETIKQSLDETDFDFSRALEDQYQELTKKKDQINHLLLTIEKTIRYHKGEINMSDKEKFEAFKQEKLAQNEATYGKEIREKYGKDAIESSNKQWQNLSEADFKNMTQAEKNLFIALKELVKKQDLHSESAKTVFEKHKEWLTYTWATYSKEAHIGLAEMYLADERFSAYYNDQIGNDATHWLTEAIKTYA
ncbi:MULTISPECIES: MerR family transcriptional regulator [Vagococcus]|uniref:Transcriptional activator tipA n=1 Tax=Vagococcus fluvialis bH819 TaxID=1255619 RepID=A0A1X6WPU1_9ENTE|nr:MULTISPECIES: MerR family transcriptional regulator [Vagococcus]SLM86299.1 Transcriptional activator tipA [Vagococcus fluvialis bH819]HCM88875.1 MerR family transcriptional regulator [Vagococcus sp.]